MSMILQLVVIDSQLIAPGVRELTLARATRTALPRFTPGSHVRIAIPDGTTRCYSLVTEVWPPDQSEYRLAVRQQEISNGGSQFMHGLSPGDSLQVSDPRNDFHLVSESKCSVLLAGGIGVTPLMSMAAQLKVQGAEYELHYAVRSRDAAAFAVELQRRHGDRMFLHVDESLTAINIETVLADASPDAHIYVCGPKGMIDVTTRVAKALGFHPDNVRYELFASDARRREDQSFDVELQRTNRSFTVRPDQTILQVLRAQGLNLLFDCERGDCGLCRVVVLEGTPDHRDVVLSDVERDAGNVMQICVSRSHGARLVLDL